KEHANPPARPEGSLLDLYCGVGAIALWLAPHHRKVIGVDDVKSAVFDARNNATLNHIQNASFISELAEVFVSRRARSLPPGRGLTVILDPPRAGCSNAVLK